MSFQDPSDQQMQLRPLAREPHEDIVIQYCKLQQEAEQLHALLAQEEACSRGYQKSRKLQQTKRQMQSERYFKRKTNSGETEWRFPPDFKRVLTTVRVDDGNYRSELHGFRQWVDRLEFMPHPGLHRRPLHKSPYHRGWKVGRLEGWKVGRLEEETEHLCFTTSIQYSLGKFCVSKTYNHLLLYHWLFPNLASW